MWAPSFVYIFLCFALTLFLGFGAKTNSTAVCLKYLQENCKQRTTSGQCPGGLGVGGVKKKKGCGILWEEKTISLFCSIFVVGLCFKRSYWKSNNDVH